MATVTSLKPKNAARWRGELGRFIRFGVVGASGTVLDFAILSALKYFLGWATLPANIISYSAGILNNFVLTRYWVYPERRRQTFVQLAQFVVISLIGLVLNNLIVLALEQPLGNWLANPALGYLPAKISATVLVLGWNFIANRLWTFGDKRLPKSAPVPINKDELYEEKAA
jgi:putative flippase GtrA